MCPGTRVPGYWNSERDLTRNGRGHWYPTAVTRDGGSAARSIRRLEQSWRMYHALWLSPK
eukprot:832903-Rhodomonas_salina.1